MLELENNKGLLKITAGGLLHAKDLDRLIGELEKRPQADHGNIAVVIELLPDFRGEDLGAMWKDLKFDLTHRDLFKRIAIVGDRKWEEWGVKLAQPLFSGEMRYFPRDERQAADSWARGEISD